MPLAVISRIFGGSRHGGALPMSSFLRRLIWLCMLPLVALAALLGLQQISLTMAQSEQGAQQRLQSAVSTLDLKLTHRLRMLEVLAQSPDLDEPRNLVDYRVQALAFRSRMGTEIILAETAGQMLAHTSRPLGSVLPTVPRSKGRSALLQALETKQSAVGDVVFGPVAQQALVALATPVLRGDGITAVLLTVLDQASFRRLLPAEDLPPDWVLRIQDSQGQAIAESGQASAPSAEVRRFTAASTVAPWQVVLSIPTQQFEAPLRSGAWTLTALLLAVTGIGALGGALASRRLTHAVQALTHSEHDGAHDSVEEIAAVRRLMRENQRARASALAALEESQRTFQALFEGMPDAIIFTDPTRHIRFVNPAFTAQYGYSAAEVTGRTTEFLYLEAAEYQRMGRERFNMHADNNSQPFEMRFRRKDGSLVWVETSGLRIVGLDGAVLGMLGVHRDISERKQQAEARERAAARLEDMVRERTAALATANAELAERTRVITELYDGAPCGYVSLRTDGTIVECNATALRQLGQTRENVIGHHVMAFMTPDCAEQHRQHARRLLHGGQARALEYDFVRPDGSHFAALLDADFERDENGTSLGARATLVDDSERRARDAQISEMQKELARRAEQAEAATRAKSAFLANMSHEIRTPLNAIIGLTHLLRNDSADAQQRDRLGKVAASGQHLLQVINDVLDLSKIDAGKMVLHAVDFDLDGLLAGVQAMVAEAAREKGLALLVHSEGVPSGWHGDATRLSQALLNLVANAVKFTAQGEVRVQVQVLDREGPARALLRFEVQDTGDGISPERRQALFSAFEQADNSMTRRHGGTGLGLALTRHMAELMGGEVGVHSSVGQGSTFWFTAWLQTAPPPAPFPAPPLTADRAAPAGEDPWLAEAGPAETLLRERHQGRRVLLAEDNPVNQEVASAMLEVVGLTVDMVGDGAKAVAAVLARDYDLVLMDMQMPLMDGLAATRAIRASGVRGVERLPIVAMTANAFSEDRQSCLAAGMDDHVAKPVHAEALYATLLRWLSRSA
jgi:PAS domain S-box-containing protein